MGNHDIRTKEEQEEDGRRALKHDEEEKNLRLLREMFLPMPSSWFSVKELEAIKDAANPYNLRGTGGLLKTTALLEQARLRIQRDQALTRHGLEE